MIGEHLGGDHEPAQVAIGIEPDLGPWVQALIAAGYQIYAVNPLQVARYRERHGISGGKSNTADAHTLADMVRTDRHQLRPVAGDSDLSEAAKVVTRAHVATRVARMTGASWPRNSVVADSRAPLFTRGTGWRLRWQSISAQ